MTRRTKSARNLSERPFQDEEDATMTVDRMLSNRSSKSHRSLSDRATPTRITRRVDLSKDNTNNDDDAPSKRASGKTATTTTTGDTTTSKGSQEQQLTRTNSARSFGSWNSFKTPLRTRSGNLIRSVLPSFVAEMIPPVAIDTEGNPLPVEALDDLKSVDSVDMEPALTDDIYSLMTVTNVSIIGCVYLFATVVVGLAFHRRI